MRLLTAVLLTSAISSSTFGQNYAVSTCGPRVFQLAMRAGF